MPGELIAGPRHDNEREASGFTLDVWLCWLAQPGSALSGVDDRLPLARWYLVGLQSSDKHRHPLARQAQCKPDYVGMRATDVKSGVSNVDYNASVKYRLYLLPHTWFWWALERSLCTGQLTAPEFTRALVFSERSLACPRTPAHTLKGHSEVGEL